MGNSTLERSRSRYHLALVLVVALTTQLLLPLASAGNRPRLSALSAKTGHNNTEPRRSLNSFQVQQDTIRQVSLTTNDIVYAKNTAQLYVSLPSAAGGNGNSVAPLTPATGVLGPSVFVGSEPGKLAISDNGQYLYVGLNGAAAVRRFDLATQTAGPQFGLGRDSTFGTYYPEDIEVMPGHPETVAVSRQRPSVTPRQGGVAIFDNSVQRTNAVGSFSGGNVIEFSSNGAALYAYENEGFGQPPFRKLTVDSNGLSVAATTSNLIPAAKDIKFDNGRIYASSGEIIDPEAATLVTKLPGMGFGALVAPESSVGRVYFLTPTNQPATTWTLRVHDQTTFALMGTLDVTNVNGTPSSLVRWGAHGLAFRTSANQLFLIETALVPSPDPIPTPTATPTPSPSPTPTPIDVSVRQLSLPTNDLVYDAPRQLIYGSVPSAAGNSGNSLAPIDPASGQIGQTVPVGSEPAKLALSDNGQYLYVALDGASAVRRFDLVTGTAGLQFSLGVSPDNTGPLSVRDIEVLPGNPNAVAISRLRPANFAPRFEGVAIYDNGVQRPTTTTSFGGAGMLEFSASANTLYGMDIETGDGFFKMAVDGNGVTNVINTQGILNGSDFKFSNGLVFATSGQVLDPETRLLTGTYSASGLVLPDPTAAKVYFLTGSGTTRILKAFDRNTFLPLGQFNVTGVTGTTGSLIRWGTDGLAFRTSSGQIFLIQTSLVSSNPNPTPTPTPTSTPTPTPTPLPTPTYSRQISLATGDLVYDSAGQKIYASIPANAGNAPNSLLPIDPIAGITGAAVVIGTDPGKLAISANNQFIYAALNGSTPGVRRFDIASQTPGLQFSLGSDSFSGNYYVQDMKVFPDNPGAIAIARRNIVSSDQHEGVVIYDDGVARPHDTQSPSSQFPSNVIVFGSTPATIYGLDTQDSAQTLHKLSVDASGVSFVSSLGSGLLGSSTAMSFSHPLVYGAGGIVLDPETKTPVGTFTGLASTGFFPLMTVDAALNRVFFLVGSSGAGGIRGKILAYDKASFVPLGAVDAGPVSGTPSSLIRWGTNGLAFRTSGNQVVLIQTQLVSAVGNVPGVIKFDASDFSANESQSFAAVTVNRTGDASNSASVDYATSDGSAKQRKDYTITRGTLSFGPSEISKTFIVPLSDNAYVDGTRKFNVLLSNPVGAGFDGANAATVTITDNDFSAPTTNPLDNSNAVFFVTQHYADFLSRLPDAAGGSFWRGQITQCGSDQACLRSKRIDVSNAFFYELEYQQTGSYVYRLYRAAFGNNQPFPNPIPDANHPGEEKKVPAYPVFAQDRALVVGGANLAQAQLDLANAFVQRSEFILKYPPSLDGPGFVDLVMATIRDDLGTDLNAQRAALITLYNAGGRGAVMYRLADDNLQTNPIDNRLFIDAEYNRAFVATQYFGYLRRDPDMAGFIFWLSQVSSAPLRDVPKQHAMVCSFTTSAEYQQRFSSVVTHSNSECQQ